MNMQTVLSQNKQFTGSPSQFTFPAPTARRVSLAGDFNNWDTNAAPMHKGPDGIWRLGVALGPGRYEYRFYADGVWLDDPTARQRAKSGLGTENCVRVIGTDSGRIEAVKNAVVAAIKGTGDVVQATVNAVTQTLTTTIKDTGQVGTSVTDATADVARGAVRAAVKVGADLGNAAQGIMLGVLRGTKATGSVVLDTISHTAQVAIRDTAAVGGDVEVAATGLVRGAIAGAKELGISAEDAAAAAVNGALKAAGEVGSTALQTVRRAVSKPIDGIKTVPTEKEKVVWG
jgi:hypothetical protein